MKEKIFSLVKKIFPQEVEFSVEVPENFEHGHYATNIAMRLAPILKKQPLEIARDVAEKMRKADGGTTFEEIEIAPPGFINFWLSKAALRKGFADVVRQKEKYGKAPRNRGAPIIFEYSDPNIAKRMHVGHLRATIIGDALANIFEFLGWKAIRWNYLGDWGTQFGKIIAAYKLWGNRKEAEKNPIEALNFLYVRFHNELEKNPNLEDRGREEFKKLEDGDAENRKLWQWFKKESLKEFEGIYRLLGVKFDTYIGESFYEKGLGALVANLVKKGIAERSEGSLVVPLEKYGLPPAMIQKSDGASLYLTRDIANLVYRISRYKPQRIVYVVGNEQSLHFSQLFAIASLLGLDASAFAHVKYGLVLGEGNKKFATREGRAVLLKDVIQEAVQRARTIIDQKREDLGARERERIAEAIGIGALKYNDLSQNRLSDIAFNWDKMLNLEGNSAPYLIYTYARLRSILRKTKRELRFDPKALESKADFDLILKLLRFPEALEQIVEDYFPHHLTDYLYELAKQANAFYQNEPVLKADPRLRAARLALVRAVAGTLKTGLELLGIYALERM